MEKKRIAVIDYDKCNYEKCGNYLCEKLCPVNRNGKECIVHEEGKKPVIAEELCIGCEICQNRCPFRAISIVNIRFELKEEVHSFGKNAFRLYGLTTPKQKNVLGLVGRNGIGKTTMVKILSGEIIPNFGENEKDSKGGRQANSEEGKKAAEQKVLEHYKGKELKAYFEGLYGKFKVAVKPQNIEGIKAKGTVRALLEKVDEKKELENIAEELNIANILDRNVEGLSGGEFQKIAIAATGLKKADLYFFDEPTSFLDIKERLRVAKFIRKLAETAVVIVIEHDLILLDYLSDHINLMYGQPRVYGFVSQLKTTREGINDYFEGYSKEENYRFRAQPINFFTSTRAEKKSKAEKTIEWQEIRKKLGNFELSAKANSIQKDEVVGIVGPNGIGKTTFMKILAGELTPDNGKLEARAKISYKPQYVSYTGNKTVGELFEDVGAEMDKAMIELIKPLELEELLENKAKNLSGGEMQRLAIALCLSKKADIYLLDEPSAYLDVEQRLMVGKTIRGHVDVNNCSALVIDHDLTLIDYVSDKVMVFSGEPTRRGVAEGPFSAEQGMNLLLKNLDITVRRDKDTKRPRINKQGSVLDQEQKLKGNYYY